MKDERLDAEKARLEQELKERMRDLLARAQEDLIDKYCFVGFDELLLKNRTRALKVRRLVQRRCRLVGERRQTLRG